MSDKDDKNGEVLCCSFCGKSQNEVKKLVAGAACTSVTNA